MDRSWAGTVFLTLVLLVGLTAAAPAQLSFTSTTYSVPGQAQSVAHGDFNFDGKPDMAVGWSSNVRVYLASSPGVFGAGADYNTGSNATQIVPGYYDANGNGLDLAVMHRGEARISLLLNNGNGTFTATADAPLAAPGQTAVAGDFNNDGSIDLAVLECTATSATAQACQIEVLLSNNDGTFRTGAVLDPGVSLQGLATGDFDGDGNLDIATTTSNPLAGGVYYGLGAAQFSPLTNYPIPNPVTIAGSIDGPSDVAVGDLDGSGYADFAFLGSSICGGSACGQATVYQWFNSLPGQSGFDTSATTGGETVWTTGGGGSLLVADFVGSPRLQLVYRNGAVLGGGLEVVGFAGKVFDGDVSDVAARDMNLDGFNDLLFTSQTATAAMVAMNKTTNAACAPPDSHALQAKICGLIAGQNLPADVPFTIHAAGNSPAGVGRLELWVDGAKQSQALSDHFSMPLALAAGKHTLAVVAVDRLLGYTSGSPVSVSTLTLNFTSTTGCAATAARTVVICSPANNSSVTSPATISAAIQPGAAPITYAQVYVDGVKQYQIATRGLTNTGGQYLLNVSLPLSAGTHRVTVQALDSAGGFKATVYATVVTTSGGGTMPCPTPSSTRTVAICSPTSGATVGSSVAVSATATAGSSPIKAMQLYVDGVKKYEQTNVTSISTSVALGVGTHRITVQALDSAGAFKATENITVQ